MILIELRMTRTIGFMILVCSQPCVKYFTAGLFVVRFTRVKGCNLDACENYALAEDNRIC